MTGCEVTKKRRSVFLSMDMRKNEYDLYYFEEPISCGQIFFDHKLKSGQFRGGVGILEICRYPDSIVSEAKSIVAALL